ncbi:hypothetical protein [Stenotrophomonas sp. CFBP8994]|uniref:prepilin-type N-terminal cleavage/methylation domain-containing protein n=1 Tax=Stenotrophomonas sp. CFBP8994 TaxID=3096527 RepID=UPI002A6999B8|nr:hypothetical protein [Stenotrophomonas sp. CFBP8994]MDY0978602.1 hypothetical protein [Stenotrophomonas sp. CFBP8994]
MKRPIRGDHNEKHPTSTFALSRCGELRHHARALAELWSFALPTLYIHGISCPRTGSVLNALEEDLGGRASKGQAMRSRGFALVELSLVVGLAAIAGVGAWMAFGPTSAGTRIQQEAASLTQLADAIAADFAVEEGRYQSVSTASAVERGLAPSAWVVGQELNSRSLGSIELSPLNAGQGFRITATAVQANLCLGLVQSSARAFSEVHVNGVLVYSRRSINHSALAESCAEGGEVAFDRR